METTRNQFQGVTNIIRFNWHFYAMAIAGIFFLLFFGHAILGFYSELTTALCVIIIVLIGSSLAVSYYIYDASDLYTLNWLSNSVTMSPHKIVNIHAGFDETSLLLKTRFPKANLVVLDFYDSAKHTEISIERARKAYPAYPGTISVSTSQLPIDNNSVDAVFLILAAHEIRSAEERILFFKEIERILKPKGILVLTEHLRDRSNFLAYTFGAFHFFSKKTWYRCINSTNLVITKEQKITPFIQTFFITKID